MPAAMREYREPFVGGGGIFFATRPQAGLVRWINDMNAGLVEVYRALAQRPEEFIRLCREIEPGRPDDPMSPPGERGGLPVNARLKAAFDAMALNTECDQALRYFFVNRTVFGGRVNYDLPSRLYFSNPDGWNIVEGGQLERAAKWLAGTRITNGDYAPLFTEPGQDVWIYADPPYLCNTKLSDTSRLYQHSFDLECHTRLASVVRECEHKVCVSYDDDPEGVIRSLYKDMTFIENEWAYCGTTNEEKEVGKELLILNYKLPTRTLFLPDGQLHGEEPAQSKDELDQYEAVIRVTVHSFHEVGQALRTIRDRRLYREVAGTFDEYCRSRWDFARRLADRLIDAASIHQNLSLSPIGLKPPETESQARELARLRNGEDIDHEKVAEVWKRVVDLAGDQRITAKTIRAEVDAAIGREPKEKAGPDAIKAIALLRLLPEPERLKVLEFIRSEWAGVSVGFTEDEAWAR
jgi:DNA adenine methylase